MTRVRWAVLAAVVAAGGGGGCVSCESRSARANYEVGPACEVPVCDRRHVYAVLVNGACPAGSCSLEGLRDGLIERGLVKNYFGQVIHLPWLAYEMHSVNKCDPAARFVVVGADVGAPAAAALARFAVAHGMAVDALVLLDPVMTPGPDGCPTRTVLVSCGSCDAAPHTERATVPGATRLTLPGHPGTVELVAGLLKESAMKVEHPPAVFDDLTDPAARPPRDLTPPPGTPAEWLFLYDHPGFIPAPLPQPLPPQLPGRPRVGPIAPALVPRDGYPPPESLPRPQFPPLVVPTPLPAPPTGQPLPAPRPVAPAP